MEGQEFDNWIRIKKEIHFKSPIRTINEGEIWWCGMGQNVGVEINGKGDNFARPVLILRKLSKLSFIGVPMTSKQHVGSWYQYFCFKGRDEYAVLMQVRMFSTTRLYRKMGSATDYDIQRIRYGLSKLLFG